MKSFESLSNQQEILPEEITLPHAEAAIALYEKEYSGTPERVEKLKEIFQVFVEQGIANTQVFTSEAMGASFPWSVIRMPELAKALYEKHGALPPIKPISPDSPGRDAHSSKSQEFIFGSAFAPEHGDEFVFAEEAMHQVIKRLPKAFEDIKAGKEPEDFEVCMVGMPTNLLGNVSPEFVDGLKDDPYEPMGKLYADFLAQRLDGPAGSRTNVQLYGISMGGGFAAKTGEKLLQDGLVVQENDENTARRTRDSKPLLQIRAMMPVSLGNKENKNWQIMGGFMVDGAISMATMPNLKLIGKGIPEFQKNVNALLAERGIYEHMDEAQKKLKDKAIHSIIFGLGKKLEIDPSVTVTKVVGLRDLTMYSPSFNKEAHGHREEHGGTLGEQIVPRNKEHQRTFGIRSGHTIPFFRDSEFRRMDKAAEALGNIN